MSTRGWVGAPAPPIVLSPHAETTRMEPEAGVAAANARLVEYAAKCPELVGAPAPPHVSPHAEMAPAEVAAANAPVVE